jgi:hypothetical protein
VNIFSNPVEVTSTVDAPILGIDNKDGGAGAINGMKRLEHGFPGEEGY